jgi:anti-sigma regulatory factor (Ser/Thr protein kinase)
LSRSRRVNKIRVKELSLHILDIVQNAITAGASLVEIGIDEDLQSDTMTIVVKDNGKGMTAEVLEKVCDPYYTSRTTRRVGLGIPLLKQNAEQTGGRLQLESEPGKGTLLEAVFGHQHIDRAALGDMPGVVAMLCGANPDMDFVYRHRAGEGHYCFDTREVKEALEGLPISEAGVIRFIREMIRENLDVLNQ